MSNYQVIFHDEDLKVHEIINALKSISSGFSISIVNTVIERDAVEQPLAPDAANAWRKDGDTITDDCGSVISAWCQNGCGKTMQVVRPGKFQCSECN